MTATVLSGEDAREELYAIMRGEACFEEKAQRALDLGKRYLDVDNGHLTRIDEETAHWEALISTDAPDGQFPPGLELDLSTTYCRRTIEASSPVALSNVPEQGWEDDPAFEEHGLHCYHGTTLVLDDEPYGTVCFVSDDPRGEPFSESETMFAELIARMLERELEHEQHEAQLTRQTNLACVLNRVLRHNIRNDMTVIRGYTQLMKETGSDALYAEKALQNIDKLLGLSSKARELDRIVGETAERKPVNIGTLTAELVERFRTEYPATTFRTDIEDDAKAAVFPTFERAVEELIVNAVKHAGASPTVEIAVKRVPNSVEIHIADDGPGLNEQEQAVFTTGIETPLIHGSGLGLWVVHWIVSSHGGSVEASVGEAGTTMTIVVPHGSDVAYDETVAEIQQARDLYEAAFEDAMDAMVIFDDEAKILDANPQAKAIFGVERQQLLGRSIREFLPAEFDFEAAWEDFTDGGAIGTVEFVRADGESRTVEYTAKPDVVPGHHFAIYRDVSERLKIEEQLAEERLFADRILNAVPNMLYVFDSNGYPIRWNTPVEDVTGYSGEEIPDRHVTEFIPDDEVEKITEAFRSVVEDGRNVTVISAFETKDGNRIPHEFTGAPVEGADGRHLGLVGIGRRLTNPASTTPGRLERRIDE